MRFDPKITLTDFIISLELLADKATIKERRVIGYFRGDDEQGYDITRKGDLFDVHVYDNQGNYAGGNKREYGLTKAQAIATFKAFFGG